MIKPSTWLKGLAPALVVGAVAWMLIQKEAAINSNEIEMRDMLSQLGSEHGDSQNAIQWFKHQGKSVSGFLMAAYRDSSSTRLQQARIIETLGELRDANAVPLLAGILQSGEWSWETAQALGKIGTPDAEDTLLQNLTGKRLSVVKECTQALGYLHTDTATAALQKQLQHTDAAVRYYAVQALVQAQPKSLFELLRRQLIKEPDDEVRKLIERSLKK